MKTERICIYPDDIQRITGKSERSSRRLLTKIKDFYDKEDHQFITVAEFASYCGLRMEEITPFL